MRDWGTFGALLLTAVQIACSGGSDQVKASGTPDKARIASLREDALASAKVWMAPAVPIPEANLRDNPAGAGAFAVDAEVACRFKIQDPSGLTPKFYCELPNGDVLKIKY